MEIETPKNVTIKGILGMLMASVDDENKKNKRLISLGMGDPTAFSCFTTTSVAKDAVVDALCSHKFNGYSPTVGLPQTRRYHVSSICLFGCIWYDCELSSGW